MSSFDFTPINAEESREAAYIDFGSTSAPSERGNEFNSIFNPTKSLVRNLRNVKASSDARGESGRKTSSGPQAQLNLSSLRARREAQIILNRKAKRSSRMAMQRRINVEPDADASAMNDGSVGVELRTKERSNQNKVYLEMLRTDMKDNYNHVFSGNIEEQIRGTRYFRKLLGSDTRRPPHDEIIEFGVMPRIIDFLTPGMDERLQREAAWTVSNMACCDGDGIGAYLVSCKSVEKVVALLMSAGDVSKERLREMCLSCVGNLSAWTVECRDLFLSKGILGPMLSQLGMRIHPSDPGHSGPSSDTVKILTHTSPSLATMTYLSWSFDNLAKGEPGPPPHYTRSTMLPLSCLLYSPDDNVRLTVMNTMLTLCENSKREENIQLMFEHGMLSKVFEIVSISREVSLAQHDEHGGLAGTGKYQYLSSKFTLDLSTHNLRQMGLRIFSAVLRDSRVMLHRRTLVCQGLYPHLLAMLVEEIGRTAETKPSLGTWGGMRTKGNNFYQGTKANIFDLTPGFFPEDESQKRTREIEERKRLEVEFDIKLELISATNAVLQLDTPLDRKYTYYLLERGLIQALLSVVRNNYFNLNWSACHCVSLLLERIDFQTTPREVLEPTIRGAFNVFVQSLGVIRQDVDTLVLILNLMVHLLQWGPQHGMDVITHSEAIDIQDSVNDLPTHSHPDVANLGRIICDQLDEIVDQVMA